MNYKEALVDFCNELISTEDKEWKPVQCFRTDQEVKRDEARYEMASEIADRARGILKQIADEKTDDG